MSRNPNYYPPGGHDWLGTDEIRQLAAQDEALIEEKYAAEVGTFRNRFYDKLAAHQALSGGFGWAIFSGEVEEGNVGTIGGREILLIGRIRREAQKLKGYTLPLIRIVTNELVSGGDKHFYLTEDVTIEENGCAQYLMDVVDIVPGVETGDAEVLGQTLMRSRSPLFFTIDNKLALTNNAPVLTTIYQVTDPADMLESATPFGWPTSIEDRNYALAKAQGLLGCVLGSDPTRYYTQP